MTDKLDPNTKIDVEEILQDLENYHPPRKGWTWRTVPKDGVDMGGFHYRDMSEPLENSVPMPTAKYFEGIDPQPIPVVTSEIASGHFEDDIRRMRMAAWNGADHIMVIRTTGQSHIDGLMEGTPEGIGGVPITRKQLRASRKACDLIEEEVGRPINFHSYVSGIAGPEVAVLFAEEGVNGAHQDPQYNVLYRNINAYRSYVDAGEAKKVMTGARIFQIDGAHNANATARHGWKVMPELMVQHGLNSAFSAMVGMPKDLIGLSTVPPSAPPTPKLWYDLPYAVALRDFFSEYKMRAQQNTRYIESDINEAIRLHVIDTLISMLTSADIQSTITPDEAATCLGTTTRCVGCRRSSRPGLRWTVSRSCSPSTARVPSARWCVTSRNAPSGFLRRCCTRVATSRRWNRGSSSTPRSSRSATTTASPATARAVSPSAL